MHLDQLLLVLDLAQTHSFNQTAERHYTTQQNVSYSIKQLENELNIKIFNRSKTGVSFTKEGQYVLECARQMYASWQELQQNLGQNPDKTAPPEKVTLYISSVLLTDSMPAIIKAFGQSCPQIKLFIKEVSNDVILQALLNGSCDVAMWSVNHGYLEKNITPDQAAQLSLNVVMHDKSVAVVSTSSQLAAKELLTISDTSHASKTVFGVFPIDYFGKDVSSYVLYHDNNLAIHQQLTSEGSTICFTSEIMYQKFFPKEQFLALPFEYPTLPYYHMLLRRKDAQHAVYDVLDQIITRELTKH
ncbi:MAG: LysR family transcriptional regulator [Peptococcaceae bacterium]|nr:LysR family transcriptional regulator [Peptococcaceae bacterium]